MPDTRRGERNHRAQRNQHAKGVIRAFSRPNLTPSEDCVSVASFGLDRRLEGLAGGD
jgi:hypothetical protein